MRLRALVVAACLVGTGVQAATFAVTNLNDSGAGSLRDAVAQANASPGHDTITFAVTGTINLDNTAGSIGIVEALTIQGPGSAVLAIDAGGTNRIFSVIENGAPACPALSGPSDYLVSISGLTIRNGQRNVANSVAGAIFSAKSLSLQDMVFENNRARGGGAVFFSVQHPGQALTVANARFSSNQATEIVAPTTGSHIGGAIGVAELCTGTRTMPVTVTIEDSLFNGNVAQAGAVNARGSAIFVNGDADVAITRTTIEGNKALPNPANANVNAQGAFSGAAQTLTLRDTTIAGNEAERSAALHLFNDLPVRQSFQERMRVLVINSTISGNRAYVNRAVLAYANVDLQLRNSTLVGNRSDQNRVSGIGLLTGPTVPASASDATPPTLRLESSVLWNPLGSADVTKDGTTMPAAFVTTANNAIVGRLCDASCGANSITLAGTGNQLGVDPLLGPLAANGGPTQTRVPQLGSPAIDKGNNITGLANDQRGAGFPRTVGALTDAGATEYTFPAHCEGFSDVAGNDSFCPSVAWLKNRSITQGCGGGAYCPNDAVIRMHMAAFMKRLGEALAGASFLASEAPGVIDFTAEPVVCQTTAIPASNAPRRAALDAVFSGLAGADSLGRANFVVSEDGGATWNEFQLYTVRTTFRANLWRSLQVTGTRNLEANKTVRFGLKMNRPGAGASGVLDSTCRLRVRVENSSGFTPL